MTKAAVALLCLLSSPAFAGEVILTAQDNSPPTTQCDDAAPYGYHRTRPCYLPPYGPAPDQLGPFRLSHNNPAFSIDLTLLQETTVTITYEQLVFLDSELAMPNNCQPGLPSCAAYESAIGIGGTDSAHICGVPGGAGGIGIIGAQSLDFPAAMGFRMEATCVLTLPAGTTVIYPLESARDGAFAFNGPGEQLLMVRYEQ